MVTCIMSSHFDAKNTVIEDLDKTKIKSTLKAFLVYRISKSKINQI